MRYRWGFTIVYACDVFEIDFPEQLTNYIDRLRNCNESIEVDFVSLSHSRWRVKRGPPFWFVDKRQAFHFSFSPSPLLLPVYPRSTLYSLFVPNDCSMHSEKKQTLVITRNRSSNTNYSFHVHPPFLCPIKQNTWMLEESRDHRRGRGRTKMLSHKLCQDKNAHSSA